MTNESSEPIVQRLSRMEFKPLREVWPDEARHFTPWLLENSEYLAESLGIDLELEVSEHAIGAFSLDLFGRDVTHECPLIVENQLESTDHRHLGQLLTYAAGTDAKTVVWISAKFRDEHRQALEYLNDLAGDNARFFGIEVQVAVIADSPPAPLLNLVVQPSDWRSQVSAQRSSAGLSNSKAAYQSFWGQYLDQVHEQHPGLTNVRSPQGANWMNLNFPRKGTYITSGFIRSGKLTCELYIDVRPASRNSAIFEALLRNQTELEAALGTKLLWDRMEGKQACRIRLEHDASIADEESWPSLIEWLMKWQVAFKQVFYPAVQSLDDSLWTDPEFG
jgi:hypothetical protein